MSQIARTRKPDPRSPPSPSSEPWLGASIIRERRRLPPAALPPGRRFASAVSMQHRSCSSFCASRVGSRWLLRFIVSERYKAAHQFGIANSFVSRRATAVDPVRWLLAERCQQCLFKRERPHLCMSSTCGQSLGLFRSVLGVGGRRPLAAAWPVWQSCAGQFHGVHGGHLLAAELAAGSARELTTTADSVSVRPASPGLSPLPHCQAGVLPHGRHSAANATGAYLLPSGRESAGVKGWRSAANCHSRPPGKRACSRQLAEHG